MKRTVATVLMALSMTAAAGPVAFADDAPPPPLFDIPVEVLPFIVVPPELGQYAPPLGAGARDLILGNPEIVQGGAGILGAVSCAIAALFGRVCP